MSEIKGVTIGGDGLPTIVFGENKVLPRRAELIIHSKYYPLKTFGEWPVDPKTKQKLEIFML